MSDWPRRASQRFLRLSVTARWAVVFLVIVAVYLSGPARSESDEFYAYATANSIVHRGTLDLRSFKTPRDYHVVSRSGQLLSGSGSGHPGVRPDLAQDYRVSSVNGRELHYYPWTSAFLAVPFVLALDLPHLVGIGPGGEGLGIKGVLVVEEIIGSLCAAGGAVLIGIAAGSLVTNEKRRFGIGLVVALLFAFTTSAWSTVSRDIDQHGPSVVFLAGSLCCTALIARGDRRSGRLALGLGVLLAGAYMSRPTDALIVAAIAIRLAVKHRQLLVPGIAGGLLVVVPWLVVTKVEYGTWQQPYFTENQLSRHPAFGEALTANLFSPSRGLLVYSLPIVVLALAGTTVVMMRSSGSWMTIRLLAALLVGSVVATWVAVSAYPVWWAGYSYGPRFLTDAGVPLAFLAAPAVERLLKILWSTGGATQKAAIAVVGVALLWSVFVHGQGAFFTETTCWNAHPNIDADPERVWEWSDAQFFAGVRSIPTLSPTDFVLGRCPSNRPPVSAGS